MILIDTSVWVDLLRGQLGSKEAVRRLPDIVTCGPVVQEILQGLEEQGFSRAFQDALLEVPRVEDPLSLEVFLEAAEIYRVGRRKGYTIRSTVDCLVAAIAMRHDAVVWHKDRDFDAIARFTALRVKRAASIH